MALTDLITISSSVLPDTTRVIAFRGVEAISRTYEFEIFLSLEGEEGDGLDLGDAIGAKAQLVIDRADDNLPPFVFAGILASVELLHAVEGRSLVRAVLVPRLWLLGLSKHSRIFTKKKLPEVIESILEENSLSGDDYELRLGSYETEEHICQYRESDLDFISRWMEREGIYYYFIHGEEGEKLIISDGSSYEEDILGKPVRYYPQTGQDRSAGASFRAFTSRHRTLPSMVKLKDYDYARPNLTITGSAQVSSNGAGEVSLYGERFFSAAAGERLAKLRAEEMLAREVVYQARGTRSHLRAGHVFEIEEHPRAALNARYLAVEVRHHGNQAAGASAFKQLLDLDHDEVYFVEVEATPEGTQFRPESRTQWPRIYGYENGTVDGPADSEYAQIDDHGRYSVKFKFDETNLKDGKASTFVRMMQPHGGGIEGFHFPLRKGTEVVFSFLGGDPDRPVISGVVPNALTPSPVTSGNHTKNVIQTGGRNRLELEDKNGQQRVTLSTPYSNSYVRMGSPNEDHELIVRTDDNTLLHAGKNYDQKVGENNGGTWTVTVANDWKSYIKGGMSLGVGTFYGGPKAGCIGIAAHDSIGIEANTGSYTLTVKKGPWTTKVPENSMTTTTKGDYTVTVTANNTKIDTQNGKTDILSKGNIKIESASGDITIDAKTGKMTINAKSGIDITSEGDISVKGAQKWYQYTAGDWIKFNSSSGISLTMGITSDTKIGIANENFIGGKVSTTVGGFAEFNAAYKFSVTAAVAMEFKFGASLCINAAAEVTAKATRVNGVAAAIENMPTWMGTSAVRFSLSGVHTLM
ncbi:type VI secretion system Vgr family protein [Polyangium jinanense]|uniref:Type VI secretion system tip protein VgrG n=1 Tax=Polyangium jinanense TaxID=2829994 RepID=A0A9X4APM0_9BACT|nr:type VI secretion system tip protein TssI/VgrG [Polyangium jinanense]MDC3952525.1 type VI secretion system tip protein VgrG [Polyangium jinanense]MDC3980153.1 type VI secretion system tip protein VgrG [Polyangium jinanense]